MATAHYQRPVVTTLISKTTTLGSLSRTLMMTATTCAFLWHLSSKTKQTQMVATCRSLRWTIPMIQSYWALCSSSSSILVLSMITRILLTCTNRPRSTLAVTLFTLPTSVMLPCLMVLLLSRPIVLASACGSLLASVQVGSFSLYSSWFWSSVAAAKRARKTQPRPLSTIRTKKHRNLSVSTDAKND